MGYDTRTKYVEHPTKPKPLKADSHVREQAVARRESPDLYSNDLYQPLSTNVIML